MSGKRWRAVLIRIKAAIGVLSLLAVTVLIVAGPHSNRLLAIEHRSDDLRVSHLTCPRGTRPSRSSLSTQRP
jgi:hypothetical protein